MNKKDDFSFWNMECVKISQINQISNIVNKKIIKERKDLVYAEDNHRNYDEDLK